MSDDEDLTRACQWCGRPFRLGTIGRRAVYCGRSCRELAYRERRMRGLIAQAVAQATAVPSTDERPRSDSTVDGTERGQPAPIPRRAARRPLGPGTEQPTLDEAEEAPAEPSLLPHELFRQLPPGLG